jgi:hypothetical protein
MLGGKVVPFRNLIWVKPLLPITFRFFQAGLRGPARRTAMVMSTLFDRVLDAVKHQPNLPRQSDLEERQLIVEDLLEYSNWSFPRDLIRPQYDRKYAEWIFDLAEQRRRYGDLQKRKVVDGKGRMLGWYVYYPNPGGIAFVLQVAA